MTQLENLNRALAVIEASLEGDVDYEAAARAAGCSRYQLERMFPYLANVSLAEYVRRRKMTRVASDLLDRDARVIDVALRYGYDSPTAFARAFKCVHGISPSEAKNGGVKLASYPRLVFTLSVKGEEPMDYKIVEKPAFRVVGVPSTGEWELEDAGEKAVQYWVDVEPQVDALLGLSDGEPAGLLGVQFCRDGAFDGYMACVATQAPCPDGMAVRVVPAATYAVFECTGDVSTAMGELWHRVLSEWLPSSGFSWESGSDVERYLSRDMHAADSRSELWLPVVRAE